MPFQGLICLQHIEKVLIQVHSFFLSHHHDRDVFPPCGPVALGGHITVMDMSAFRFSCPAARTHHVHEPRCAGERRERRRRREGCERVHVRGRVHVPTATARTAQGPRAAAACVGSSRGSHWASDVEGPAPAAPESIESPSSPVPLTQSVKILYRLSQPFFSSPPLLLSPIDVPVYYTHPRPFHALPLALLSASTTGSHGAKQHTPCAKWYLSPFHDSDLGASIHKASLRSRRQLREEITNTLVGLEGTGFILVVSSSTGAAWELFRNGGGCPYGSGGKGWLARMSSSGGGAGAVQARLYYIGCVSKWLSALAGYGQIIETMPRENSQICFENWLDLAHHSPVYGAVWLNLVTI
ncbi:hypothetical protein JB92DRAFT_2832575 [Gautieria morchelliformis]|nr:hypothetical protein JB92DRAFT_2832575 [Gautieria morchelliformis]